MPNHFTTIGLCSRDWSRDEDNEVDLTPIDGLNLCEVIAPLPNELANIVATHEPCRYRHKATGEWFDSCDGPETDREQYERVPLTASEIESLKATHGAATWYDWQRDNWGTKWGTYGTNAKVLGGDGSPVLIEFQTAWGPPSPEMMGRIEDYLRETFCLAKIRWIGFDPDSDDIADIPVSHATPTQ